MGACSFEDPLQGFQVEDCQKGGGCVLLPASEQLAVMPNHFANEIGKELLLKELMEEIAEKNFDVAILDSPPSFDLITINAYIAASHVLIPVQCEGYSLDGVEKVFKDIGRVAKRYNPEIKILGLAPTMFDKRKRLARDVLKNLREGFPSQIFETPIRDSVAIAEAPTYGKSIFDYDPKGYGSIDYACLRECGDLLYPYCNCR